MNYRNSLFTDDVTKSERYLHTPGHFAKENLFYVQETGKLKSLVPHRCIREGLDSFLVMLVISGRGMLKFEDTVYEMTEGDCAFIDCMKHYEHISDEDEGWELAWIHFNGKSSRAYYGLFVKYFQEVPIIRVGNPEKIENSIKKIMELQKSKELMAELFTGEEMLSLLNYLISCAVGEKNVKTQNRHSKLIFVREYLNNNYSNENVLSGLSVELKEDVQRINEDFQTFFGIGLKEYVWNRRLNAAKELLRFSIKTDEQICKETGIKDKKIMEKMFFDQEGMSPEEYRKKWAQWIRK